MAEYIESKRLKIYTQETVMDILEKDDRIQGMITDKGEYQADNVILAPGRRGQLGCLCCPETWHQSQPERDKNRHPG